MATRAQNRSKEPLSRFESIEVRSHPIQERSKRTLIRILEVAAELVDEVGVVAFSTNLLAERADIRVRTIYRYFPSKVGILSALMNRLNEDSQGRLKRFSEIGDPERDWREIVTQWIDELLDWTRRRPGARLLMNWSESIPELVPLADRIEEEWLETMMAALRARGVELPRGQLYAVCCNFNETLDSMTSLAASQSARRSARTIEETRRMLIRYLELYLD